MMNNKKIWLSSPHMGSTELLNIQEAFNSNWISPMGPHVDGFESDLVAFTGVPYSAALSSGTAALHLALIILGITAGDEVLCQSLTFSASANPIVYAGAKPVFVDSEKNSWNMCPEALEKAIEARLKAGSKPRAIIVVHLYGMPANMRDILAIAGKYEIPVIEDAAEALGSIYDEKACGSFGTMSVLSFNGNKIITTSGGGALLSDNGDYIKKARFLATQARDEAPHYQHSHIGYNYRMSNICAGIGRGQMEVLSQRVTQRRKNFERYKDAFNSIEGISFQTENVLSRSNRWLSAILVDPRVTVCTREDIRLALAAQNIESRPLWKPMHLQPVFQSSPYYGGNVSEELFNNGLCLPSGSNLKDEDLERVVNVIYECLSV